MSSRDVTAEPSWLDRILGPRSRRQTLAVAWIAILIGTPVPAILSSTLQATRPDWLVPAQLVALGGLLALTTVERFRLLRSLVLALLAALGMFYTRVSWLEAAGITVPSGVWYGIATEALQMAFVVGLLVVLFADGASRDRLYLQFGRLSATAEREWVPGFRRERSWRKAGALWGGITLLLIPVVLYASLFPFEAELLTVAVLVPGILLTAAANAFGEEFVFRAAPLADLVDAIGKRHALFMLGAFFGLSHYFGTPGGAAGVALTGFYGWLLAKSIFETRGLGFALTLHFVADVAVIASYTI